MSLPEQRLLLLCQPVRDSRRYGPQVKGANHQTRQEQFLLELLEEHVELGILAPPSAGPLLVLVTALLFGPCVLTTLTRFVSSRLEAVTLQMMLQTDRSSVATLLWMARNPGRHFPPLDIRVQQEEARTAFAPPPVAAKGPLAPTN